MPALQSDLNHQNQAIRARLFLYLCLGIGTGAAIWGLICTVRGSYMASLLPYGLLLLTLVNLGLFRIPRLQDACMHGQVLMGLLWPFLFQSALGGIAASGMVMFWSFVALAGALTFQRRMIGLTWITLEVLLVMSWTLSDPVFNAFIDRPAATGVLAISFLAFNVTSVTIILFGLAMYFVRVQGRSRKRLHEVRQELTVLNDRLQDRSTEIAQSMAYASRIQRTILPDLDRHPDLFEDHAVLLRSKDTVGGDMYWSGTNGSTSYLVLLDCTGHGIPGAMLTMLCHGVLNEVVFGQMARSSAEVIDLTQQRLDDHLDRHHSGNKDSAEMAVICFDRERGTVTFAGLGCSLMIAEEKEVRTIRGARALPTQLSRNYTVPEFDLDLSKDPTLFLFSDGVVDQFDTHQRRKFTQRRLESAIESTAGLPLPERAERLHQALQDWKGSSDQTDDMLLIGLQLSQRWVKKEALCELVA